jgi:pimeloyl-ACP methyl ester carboxylesterase
MATAPAGLTVPEITHHRAHVNGATLHYAAAGTSGSPVLLVHGFPETWRAFRKLIPLLAAGHRVFAVDLRGFGDSGTAPDGYDRRRPRRLAHRGPCRARHTRDAPGRP